MQSIPIRQISFNTFSDVLPASTCVKIIRNVCSICVDVKNLSPLTFLLIIEVNDFFNNINLFPPDIHFQEFLNSFTAFLKSIKALFT